MKVSHEEELRPEGKELVGLRSEAFASLGLRSVEIAMPHLKHCGIVAV